MYTPCRLGYQTPHPLGKNRPSPGLTPSSQSRRLLQQIGAHPTGMHPLSCDNALLGDMVIIPICYVYVSHAKGRFWLD